MLIRQAHLQSVIFATTGIFWCFDLLMMSINLNDIAVLNIHGVDYRCNIYGISKSDAVNLLKSPDLTAIKILIFQAMWILITC